MSAGKVDVPEKRAKFSFEEFKNSFSSLDPQNIGGWPMPVKITIYIFVFVVILVLGYLLLIGPTRDDITNAESRQQQLLSDYRDKDSKLRNLLQYQRQVEQMESTFGQLLQQLPKVQEIPGLVEDINYTGVGSGLKFDSIKVEKEVPKDIFIVLPITIQGRGDYHAFGAFVSALASLPRIVTIDDFTIAPQGDSSKASSSEVPVLGITVNAKTYRYNDQANTDKKKPAAAGAAPGAAPAGSAS